MTIFRTLVFAVVLAVGISGSASAQSQGDVSIGHSDIIKLVSQAKGKVVVLNFWASWCPPCREEIPELIAMRKKFPEDKVLFLGISMDQDPAAYARFAAKAGFNYPVYLGRSDVAMAFSIRGIPRTLVYGPDGQQELSHEGYLSGDELGQVLTKLLGS